MDVDRPRKPLVVYDGDCAFCRRWVEGWRRGTGDRVEYAAYQEVADQFPGVPAIEFERAVQFFDEEGRRCSGAEAVFRILALATGRGTLLFLYRWLPGFAIISRLGYRVIARHRGFVASPARWLWGEHFGPSTYRLSRNLFLRLLGVIYLIAFFSYGVQILGLNGSHGILPAADFLARVQERIGVEGHWWVQTLCWWRCDDWFLKWFLCGGGSILAGLLIVGLAPAPILVLLWAFYLSIVSVGGEFMHFQWDNLLLEAGFLAIFYSPMTFWLSSRRAAAPSPAARFLIQWLLFRLMFESGVVKLTAGDDCWQSLTALTYHYETQPLPTWPAWYAHQMPLWFHKASVALMFVVELIVPALLLVAPRRMRHAAAASIIGLMALIGVTGNYNFFNLLTVVLCVATFDDAFLRRFTTRRIRERLDGLPPPRGGRYVRRAGLGLLAVFVVMVSAFGGLRDSAKRGQAPPWLPKLPRWADQTLRGIAPFRSINSYGLFRVMTKTRPEIVIEGSNDGRIWMEYGFRWKPGDVNRKPGFVEPHQPRLDWQMWFAALGSYRQNGWVGQLLLRLLEGSPEVLGLMGHNPFPDAPPRFVRAVLYDYHFTDRRTRAETGAWWRRDFLGVYSPVLSQRER